VCAWGGGTARLSGAPREGSSFVVFWHAFCRFLRPRQTLNPEKDNLSSCRIGRFAAWNQSGAGEANFAGVCVDGRRSPVLRSSPMKYNLCLLSSVLTRTICSLSSGSLCDEAKGVSFGEETKLFLVCAERRKIPLQSSPLLPVFLRT